ncbi:hypothetical protein TREES_T100017658 [Tupaia chinensis]|uniref:Uncharacterized protein n=1 Tax=Tupaia chinensis TaxID=246437 RepID=L9L4B9_TUPCH|nr:hypothetical protein TREES_T100017658 [Tupaia chinensis]
MVGDVDRSFAKGQLRRSLPGPREGFARILTVAVDLGIRGLSFWTPMETPCHPGPTLSTVFLTRSEHLLTPVLPTGHAWLLRVQSSFMLCISNSTATRCSSSLGHRLLISDNTLFPSGISKKTR